MSTLLLVPSKDLSCKIFREYPAAIKKAEQFLLEVNCEGTLQDRIYTDRNIFGKYFVVSINFTTFILSIKMSLTKDTHRIDSSEALTTLSENERNYFTYEELVEKIKQINTMK